MISCCLLGAHRSNHRKHRDIGLKFRYRSTPNTRRVTKNVGFGRGTIYIYIPISEKPPSPKSKNLRSLLKESFKARKRPCPRGLGFRV